MADKRSPGDIPRIDASDPLPAYQEPSSRWATPYITYRDGKPIHTVALRSAWPLSSRERAAGLSAQLYADSPEDLQRLIEREDATRAQLLRGGNGDES